jgi:hypothetical protein
MQQTTMTPTECKRAIKRVQAEILDACNRVPKRVIEADAFASSNWKRLAHKAYKASIVNSEPGASLTLSALQARLAQLQTLKEQLT